MNIQVMYQDNSIGHIDSSQLEDMLLHHKIQKFMRSDGWVIAGNARTRGEGGAYEGVDRRGWYGLTRELKYKIVT